MVTACIIIIIIIKYSFCSIIYITFPIIKKKLMSIHVTMLIYTCRQLILHTNNIIIIIIIIIINIIFFA